MCISNYVYVFVCVSAKKRSTKMTDFCWAEIFPPSPESSLFPKRRIQYSIRLLVRPFSHKSLSKMMKSYSFLLFFSLSVLWKSLLVSIVLPLLYKGKNWRRDNLLKEDWVGLSDVKRVLSFHKLLSVSKFLINSNVCLSLHEAFNWSYVKIITVCKSSFRRSSWYTPFLTPLPMDP